MGNSYVVKSDTLVNGGALQLALNSLRRGSTSQKEIADELEKTAMRVGSANALVPVEMTQAMREYVQEENWSWTELLAIALSENSSKIENRPNEH